MNKQEFLRALRERLSGLPAEDIEKHVQYYSEIIDDRMEDGMTEAEAVAAVELPEQMAPAPRKARQPLPVWAIVLLIVGAPIWLSLLIAAVSVAVSVYAVLWTAVITLYVVPVSLAGCALGGIIPGIAAGAAGNMPQAIACLGICLLCAGLCIFTFPLCNLAAKGTVSLTKWLIKQIRSLFAGKEAAK